MSNRPTPPRCHNCYCHHGPEMRCDGSPSPFGLATRAGDPILIDMDRARQEGMLLQIEAAWARCDASENALAAAWLEHDANLKAARALGPRPKKDES